MPTSQRRWPDRAQLYALSKLSRSSFIRRGTREPRPRCVAAVAARAGIHHHQPGQSMDHLGAVHRDPPAGFAAGKTLDSRDENASSILEPT